VHDNPSLKRQMPAHGNEAAVMWTHCVDRTSYLAVIVSILMSNRIKFIELLHSVNMVLTTTDCREVKNVKPVCF